MKKLFIMLILLATYDAMSTESVIGFSNLTKRTFKVQLIIGNELSTDYDLNMAWDMKDYQLFDTDYICSVKPGKVAIAGLRYKQRVDLYRCLKYKIILNNKILEREFNENTDIYKEPECIDNNISLLQTRKTDYDWYDPFQNQRILPLLFGPSWKATTRGEANDNILVGLPAIIDTYYKVRQYYATSKDLHEMRDLITDRREKELQFRYEVITRISKIGEQVSHCLLL